MDKLPFILKQNLDKNLCTCIEALKMDVINTIVDGATTVDEIKKTDLCHDGNRLLCHVGRAIDRVSLYTRKEKVMLVNEHRLD